MSADDPVSLPDAPPPSPETAGSRARTPVRRSGLLARAKRRVRILLRMRRLYWLRARIHLAPGESQRLIVLTALIGATCGVTAVAFHGLIRLLEINLVERALGAPGRAWIAWTILVPTLGGLICGVLLQYLVPRARGSGIPDVKATFAQRGRELRARDSLGKFAVGALQIGSGASLGREGPTVQICAGIASSFGRLARVSHGNLRRLLPVGAAAGVAAAFNAPIAAVTFAIEEIVGDLGKTVLSGVIVAAAIAAATERSVLGEHPVFDLPREAVLATERGLERFVNASDVMRPPIAVRRRDDLRTALETMLAHGIRRLPVVDEETRVLGFVDEDTIARAYLRAHTS